MENERRTHFGFKDTLEMTPDQQMTAEVLFYCSALNIFEKTIERMEHQREERNLRGGLDSFLTMIYPNIFLRKGRNGNRQKRELVKDAGVLFRAGEDIDSIDGTIPDSMSEERIELARAVIEQASPDLRKARDRIMSIDHGNLSSLKAANEVRKRMGREMSQEESEHLLEMLGYSSEERKNIKGKLALSFGLGTAVWFTYLGAKGLSLADGETTQFVKNIINEPSYRLLALAYTANYLTSIITSIQNIRLLDNPSIGTSPNFLATSTFYISEKLFPSRTLLRNAIIFLLPRTSAIFIEPGQLSFVLTSENGLLAVTTYNFLASILNILQVGIQETALRKVGKTRTEQ